MAGGDRKLRAICIAFALSITVLLTGCGASDSGNKHTDISGEAQSKEAATETDPFANIPSVDIADLGEAISGMSSLIKQLKQAVEADQADEAKELAAQMAGLWNAMKEEVRANDATKHQLLHDDLSLLIKETKASKWNKELIVQLDYKLYQSFRDMKQELQNQ
ncbi:hypothetical protein BK133_18830 [Paenibacillus sp. FSL H8-0548]|uniref:hypothetical protein n=1 Tax=Paenibacillus sp. FSL H8-0548 TaxID=1920422 RepID=UPI00096DA023|nr:hypothetical protein [Paenibacillus sp. FSL H8-0548]OMF28073.1 hypothetical protein BK133_18830 [Paenibacillus sp. FSL H8-0548]